MNCFKELVSSKFMANAITEISVARNRIIHDHKMAHTNLTHSFVLEQKKQTYYFIGNELGFFQKLYELKLQADRIYYVQYENYLMIVSSSKKLLTIAINSALNVNGDCPIHRTVHTLKKQRIHTVLYDTSFTLLPVTLN